MPTFPSLPGLGPYLERQVDLATEFSMHVCDTLRQVSALNLATARTLAEDAVDLGRRMLASADPMQMGSLFLQGLGPVSAHMQRYQQGLAQVFGQPGGAAAH